VLLMAWLIQVPATIDSVPLPDLWNYLSLYTHMDSLRRGVFNTSDVIYFLLFTLLFLWLAVLRLDMERN
jgi:ABC-2 type transport system permease protein